MQDENPILPAPKRTAWNKGKLIGAKPPLLAKHVWSIRTKLQIEKRTRDLAMFNLAIDSKLRGCDVVTLRVEDIAPSGYALSRATVRQRKTGRPVRFELTRGRALAVGHVEHRRSPCPKTCGCGLELRGRLRHPSTRRGSQGWSRRFCGRELIQGSPGFIAGRSFFEERRPGRQDASSHW